MTPALRERIAQHYERKAVRLASSMLSRWMLDFADKARAGHTNAFTRRVQRMASRRAAPAQGDLFA